PMARHPGERPDANDLQLRLRAVRGDDRREHSCHEARLGHLALHLEPEPLELVDRRQLAARCERGRKLLALRILSADHRVLHDRRYVVRRLADDAEKLAERARLRVELLLKLRELPLVLVEGRAELLAARLRGIERRLRLLEQLRLTVAIGLEALLAFTVLRLLDRPGRSRLL